MKKLTQNLGLAMIAAIAFSATLYAHDLSKEQADHQTWEQDHVVWTKDHKQWMLDHKRALTALKTLELMLKNHGEALAKHDREISTHEKSIGIHEKALASGGAADEAVLDRQHAADSAEHEQVKRTHGENAHHHAELMEIVDKIEHLSKEDSDAMRSE
jgi:hypothetical protein